MTTGAIAPVERADVEVLSTTAASARGTPEAVADDPLFAGLVCRAPCPRRDGSDQMMWHAARAGLAVRRQRDHG